MSIKHLLFVLFCSTFVHFVEAKEITLAVANDIPPYIFSGTNTGIELDIAREALGASGYEVKFMPVPLGRLALMLALDKIDGALTLKESLDVSNIYFSKPYIRYKNVAVSLTENNYLISDIVNLAERQMVAFQNAIKYLGNDFEGVAKASPDYRELARQDLQVNMLFRGRTEVIVLDINIFNYYRNKSNASYFDLPVTIHPVFPENIYCAGFKSSEVRIAFDKGIAKLRSSGRYDEIVNSYLSK